MNILEIKDKIKALSKEQQRAREMLIDARLEWERAAERKERKLAKEIERVTDEVEVEFDKEMHEKARAVTTARQALNKIEDQIVDEANKL